MAGTISGAAVMTALPGRRDGAPTACVDGERPAGDALAGRPGISVIGGRGGLPRNDGGASDDAGSTRSPAAPFEDRMGGDQRALFEDADLVGERVHLDHAPPGGVGDAVEIAADRDHAFVGDPALEFEHRAVRERWQLLQLRLLFGKGFGHHPPGGRVNAATLATVASQSVSWVFRSSRLRNVRPRKKS